MNLTPIKLIKNQDVRHRLLKVKRETHEIDTSDYIERHMNTNVAAKYLMAIEDASEVAKQFLQEKGIFEHIAKDIKKESNYDFKFTCRRTARMTKPVSSKHDGIQYLHIAHTYSGGDGHYALAKVNHTQKTIGLFNSMGGGRKEFKSELRTVYKNYTLRNMMSAAYQPTGGLVTTDVDNYTQLLKDTKISIRDKKVLEK